VSPLLIADSGPGPTGNVTITDHIVLDFANSQMPLWAGWVLAAAMVVAMRT